MDRTRGQNRHRRDSGLHAQHREEDAISTSEWEPSPPLEKPQKKTCPKDKTPKRDGLGMARIFFKTLSSLQKVPGVREVRSDNSKTSPIEEKLLLFETRSRRSSTCLFPSSPEEPESVSTVEPLKQGTKASPSAGEPLWNASPSVESRSAKNSAELIALEIKKLEIADDFKPPPSLSQQGEKSFNDWNKDRNQNKRHKSCSEITTGGGGKNTATNKNHGKLTGDHGQAQKRAQSAKSNRSLSDSSVHSNQNKKVLCKRDSLFEGNKVRGGAYQSEKVNKRASLGAGTSSRYWDDELTEVKDVEALVNEEGGHRKTLVNEDGGHRKTSVNEDGVHGKTLFNEERGHRRTSVNEDGGHRKTSVNDDEGHRKTLPSPIQEGSLEKTSGVHQTKATSSVDAKKDQSSSSVTFDKLDRHGSNTVSQCNRGGVEQDIRALPEKQSERERFGGKDVKDSGCSVWFEGASPMDLLSMSSRAAIQTTQQSRNIAAVPSRPVLYLPPPPPALTDINSPFSAGKDLDRKLADRHESNNDFKQAKDQNSSSQLLSFPCRSLDQNNNKSCHSSNNHSTNVLGHRSSAELEEKDLWPLDDFLAQKTNPCTSVSKTSTEDADSKTPPLPPCTEHLTEDYSTTYASLSSATADSRGKSQPYNRRWKHPDRGFSPGYVPPPPGFCERRSPGQFSPGMGPGPGLGPRFGPGPGPGRGPCPPIPPPQFFSSPPPMLPPPIDWKRDDLARFQQAQLNYRPPPPPPNERALSPPPFPPPMMPPPMRFTGPSPDYRPPMPPGCEFPSPNQNALRHSPWASWSSPAGVQQPNKQSFSGKDYTEPASLNIGKENTPRTSSPTYETRVTQVGTDEKASDAPSKNTTPSLVASQTSTVTSSPPYSVAQANKPATHIRFPPETELCEENIAKQTQSKPFKRRNSAIYEIETLVEDGNKDVDNDHGDLGDGSVVISKTHTSPAPDFSWKKARGSPEECGSTTSSSRIVLGRSQPVKARGLGRGDVIAAALRSAQAKQGLVDSSPEEGSIKTVESDNKDLSQPSRQVLKTVEAFKKRAQSKMVSPDSGEASAFARPIISKKEEPKTSKQREALNPPDYSSLKKEYPEVNFELKMLNVPAYVSTRTGDVFLCPPMEQRAREIAMMLDARFPESMAQPFEARTGDDGRKLICDNLLGDLETEEFYPAEKDTSTTDSDLLDGDKKDGNARKPSSASRPSMTVAPSQRSGYQESRKKSPASGALGRISTNYDESANSSDSDDEGSSPDEVFKSNFAETKTVVQSPPATQSSKSSLSGPRLQGPRYIPPALRGTVDPTNLSRASSVSSRYSDYQPDKGRPSSFKYYRLPPPVFSESPRATESPFYPPDSTTDTKKPKRNTPKKRFPTMPDLVSILGPSEPSSGESSPMVSPDRRTVLHPSKFKRRVLLEESRSSKDNASSVSSSTRKAQGKTRKLEEGEVTDETDDDVGWYRRTSTPSNLRDEDFRSSPLTFPSRQSEDGRFHMQSSKERGWSLFGNFGGGGRGTPVSSCSSVPGSRTVLQPSQSPSSNSSQYDMVTPPPNPHRVTTPNSAPETSSFSHRGGYLPPRFLNLQQNLRRNASLARTSSCGIGDPLSNVRWMNSKERFQLQYQNIRTPYIDTHCHLDFLFERSGFKGSFQKYQAVNEQTFPSCFQGCVAVFCNPRTFRTSGFWMDVLCESNVWGAVGCHPKCATDFNTRAERAMRSMIQHPKVLAVGEIGLDYSGLFHQYHETQKQVFQTQLKMALEAKLPIVIHCRDAESDCLETMEKTIPKNHKIHRHCWTGSWEDCQTWLETFPGSFIGLTPLVTLKSARAQPVREVARRLPLERLLLETDAPYFIPKQIWQDDMQYSHPGMAITVAQEVAYLKGISIDEVLEACLTNSVCMYGMKQE